jgi:hypothetical protein
MSIWTYDGDTYSRVEKIRCKLTPQLEPSYNIKMVNHEDETDTDVVRMGDMKNAYKIFALNPQDKKTTRNI